MELNRLLRFPIHIFLLPVFFIWHILNQHFVLIPFSLAIKYLLYYCLLSAGVFFIGKIILRDNAKAGCWTTILLTIFFFWGSSHDFLKGLHLPGLLISYTFLLSASTVFIILLTIYLKKNPAAYRFNKFLTFLFSLFLLMEAGLTGYKLINDDYRKSDPAYYNEPLRVTISSINDQQKPDIFFIVFDEYTSSAALKKYFSFDNYRLDSSMRANSFYIVSKSQSNYNSTALSIASTFNMQYFNRSLEGVPDNAQWLMEGSYSFKKSLLPRLLEKQGYKILNYSLYDIQGHSSKARRVYEEYEIKLLSLETLWGRIRRDILWNLIVRLPGYSEKKPPDKYHISRNRDNYSLFLNELKKESAQPRLVISHLLLPHRPAYVDRYGRPRATSMKDFEDKNHDSLYVEQLWYANTLIDSLMQATNRNRKRPLVLIIEGDHGNRYSESGRSSREKQFMNLNAWFFSDRDYSLLYDSISPVNSFRVVLNKYFNAGLPLLKDSTILLKTY